MQLSALLFLAFLPAVHNDQVVATEQRLAPGETYTVPGEAPALLVFTSAGTLKTGKETLAAKAGGIWFGGPAKARTLTNAGRAELRFVRVDFPGPGSAEVWGAMGLSPHYKMLLENRYARVYDIRIPAETREPRHTHRARVVICLSGAELRHLMPDGREETSTLKTGEIVWRPGSTHIGQNIGKTALWAIAVEPK